MFENDLTKEQKSEWWGYAIWGFVTLSVLIPELIAVFTKKTVWPTISSCIGNLEYHASWIALLVVALIVASVYQLIRYPAATGQQTTGVNLTRTALGRLTQRKPPERSDSRIVLTIVTISAGVVFAIAGGLIADAETHPSPGHNFTLGYVLYGSIAVWLIIFPSILAFAWARDVAYPTLFSTIASLERRRGCHFLAVAFVIGLVVLLIHLALYPWPGIFHQLRPPTAGSS